jgi:tripartite-type tricarboxylate transporter receptor subunit TctC
MRRARSGAAIPAAAVLDAVVSSRHICADADVRRPTNQTMTKLLLSAVAAVAGLAPVSFAQAQTFPSKPIRIIVTAIAGSAPDVRVRQVAPRLAEALGQHVIVENRPGANGTIAAQQAARAQPDGHTLMSALINNAINDLLHPHSSARLNRELAPVAQFSLSPLVMVIHPGVAAHTLQEYLQLAKAKPGLLTYASAGPGSITQLLGEWIKLKAGANILDVPYKSVGAEMPDLLGGQIKTAYLVATVIAAHVQSGKLRGLAVTGRTRLPVIREVPTTAEAGLPGIEASAWSGYVVPAGTPQPVIHTLNRELVRVFNLPEIREQAAMTGTEVIGGRPEEFAAFIRAEIVKWGGVIKTAGIKPQ